MNRLAEDKTYYLLQLTKRCKELQEEVRITPIIACKRALRT